MTNEDANPDGRAWSLISNHGHALICVARNPEIRLWELAQTIRVRERSAQRIVNQLVDAGYLTRHDHDHHGARTTYTVNRDHHLRRPELADYTVGDLIDAFAPAQTEGPSPVSSDTPTRDPLITGLSPADDPLPSA